MLVPQNISAIGGPHWTDSVEQTLPHLGGLPKPLLISAEDLCALSDLVVNRFNGIFNNAEFDILAGGPSDDKSMGFEVLFVPLF